MCISCQVTSRPFFTCLLVPTNFIEKFLLKFANVGGGCTFQLNQLNFLLIENWIFSSLCFFSRHANRHLSWILTSNFCKNWSSPEKKHKKAKSWKTSCPKNFVFKDLKWQNRSLIWFLLQFRFLGPKKIVTMSLFREKKIQGSRSFGQICGWP